MKSERDLGDDGTNPPRPALAPAPESYSQFSPPSKVRSPWDVRTPT